MHTSKKPATYIIDGLNFIRSYLLRAHNADEETLTADLISWLDELGSGELSGSDFRLILDGSYRPVGPTRTAYVNAQFTEGYPADTLILEQAEYLHSRGGRVIVVTSDLELAQSVKSRCVKVMHCGKFFNSFYR
jgi:predicted RNA-binding protein with PIN domain